MVPRLFKPLKFDCIWQKLVIFSSSLTFSTLSANSADDREIRLFSYFSQKIKFDISCISFMFLCFAAYHNYPKYLDRNATSDQDLHCLQPIQ